MCTQTMLKVSYNILVDECNHDGDYRNYYGGNAEAVSRYQILSPLSGDSSGFFDFFLSFLCCCRSVKQIIVIDRTDISAGFV